MEKNYNVEGKYSSAGFIASHFDKFWVRHDELDKKTILYTGRDAGGGYYYELDGNKEKEVKKIVDENGVYYSARPLVYFFKKNGATKIG